ncbi:MAG: hypothetical protein Q9228_002732, partial [Teloschistes exilis]
MVGREGLIVLVDRVLEAIWIPDALSEMVASFPPPFDVEVKILIENDVDIEDARMDRKRRHWW